jgi:serine/threonine protein kinase
VVTQRLGRFVLLRKLGEGGMGAVYAAYDEQLDRKIAVKLLHPIEKEQTLLRLRMLREAQAMARVSHPNVLHVYDVGELGSQIFIAMEFIDGVTLSTWQSEAPRTWQEILSVYLQAGRGLSAAHQAALVHRDFKPDNVLIDRRGIVRVGDFGLARLQGDPEAVHAEARAANTTAISQPALRSPLSQTGTLSGTPGYMSPEQFRCQPADSRSDQFSFCVALFEALFGLRPFLGDSLDEMFQTVTTGKRQEIPPATPVPIEIQHAILRGLSVDPSQRFASMDQLLDALDVDAERDPAGAKKGRIFLSSLLVVPTTLSIVLILTGTIPSHFTLANLTGLMVLVLALFSVGMLVFRRSLLANEFHRGLTHLAFWGVLSILGTRWVAWRSGIPVEKYVPVDLMLFFGLTTTIALHYLPRFWLLAPCLLAASFTALLWPAHSFQIAILCYTIVPLFFILGWSDASSRSTRAKLPIASRVEGGSSPSLPAGRMRSRSLRPPAP